MKPPMDVYPIVDKVLAMIDECQIEKERVIISSFVHDWLRQVQRNDPAIAVQALVGDLPVSPENARFETYNAWAAMVKEDQVKAFSERGVKVNIFTVNEIAEMQRFIDAGVSGIFTDFPQRLKTLT
jgi:glycerophosphoryl diester phosphodiesterase